MAVPLGYCIYVIFPLPSPINILTNLSATRHSLSSSNLKQIWHGILERF
ncbi:hypothetical protein HanPSC8_Chr17g0787951 [Helianthus annuus]|nr:hypothetical protein HanPSC8_Chr17g0787951 [Helianthus annuus]